MSRLFHKVFYKNGNVRIEKSYKDRIKRTYDKNGNLISEKKIKSKKK